MNILRIKLVFLLIAWTVPGNVQIGLDLDELDATAGDMILVKTWSADSHLMSINITRNNSICVSEFFSRPKSIIPKNKHCAFQLQTNNNTRKMSLILGKVKKRYEGEYKVEESIEDPSPGANQRTPGAWNFKLNVIGPNELKEYEVGNNILMNLKIWPNLRHLHYYDQIVATFNGSDCHVVNHSQLFGRLHYSIEHDRHVIIIQNVSQRDIGLYTLVNGKQDSQRFYLNVTDQPTINTIGDNVTINWFYSQRAINRTLQIIHSTNVIMMTLGPNNEVKVKPAFKDRLLYSGDILRSYISLTLLNISDTESGIFRIETQYGINVPGCKHLIVKGKENNINAVRPSSSRPFSQQTTDHNMSSLVSPTDASRSDGRAGFTTERPFCESGRVKNESNRFSSPEWNILFDVKYVVMGATGLIIIMICYMIWTQRTNANMTKEVHKCVFDTSNTVKKIMKLLQPSIFDEEGLARVNPFVPAGNAKRALQFSVNHDTLSSYDTESSFSIPAQNLENEKPGPSPKFIASTTESNPIYRKTLWDAPEHDMQNHVANCPIISTLDAVVSNAVVSLRPPDQCRDANYAKVKKGRSPASRNNSQFEITPWTGGKCSDGYTLVNFERVNNSRNGVQDVTILPETDKSVNVSLTGTKDAKTINFSDEEEDGGYQTCINVEHMDYTENLNVYED